MITIKILTGSVRPGRFNIQPAQWIYKIAKKRAEIKAELLDLQDINLPFLDEPMVPAMHKYTKEHTKKWSQTIAKADGFIFVTPEYNFSYSPVLKNAFDFLWHEWNYKPVSFISYGSLAGGARAVEHLRAVVAQAKMYDLREQIMLPSYREHLDESGSYQFNQRHEASANEMLDSLIFWAKKMKEARLELAPKQA